MEHVLIEPYFTLTTFFHITLACLFCGEHLPKIADLQVLLASSLSVIRCVVGVPASSLLSKDPWLENGDIPCYRTNTT